MNLDTSGFTPEQLEWYNALNASLQTGKQDSNSKSGQNTTGEDPSKLGVDTSVQSFQVSSSGVDSSLNKEKEQEEEKDKETGVVSTGALNLDDQKKSDKQVVQLPKPPSPLTKGEENTITNHTDIAVADREEETNNTSVVASKESVINLDNTSDINDQFAKDNPTGTEPSVNQIVPTGSSGGRGDTIEGTDPGTNLNPESLLPSNTNPKPPINTLPVPPILPGASTSDLDNNDQEGSGTGLIPPIWSVGDSGSQQEAGSGVDLTKPKDKSVSNCGLTSASSTESGGEVAGKQEKQDTSSASAGVGGSQEHGSTGVATGLPIANPKSKPKVCTSGLK